jgi:hypothetical protein
MSAEFPMHPLRTPLPRLWGDPNSENIEAHQLVVLDAINGLASNYSGGTAP